jgi:hypothetical protein
LITRIVIMPSNSGEASCITESESIYITVVLLPCRRLGWAYPSGRRGQRAGRGQLSSTRTAKEIKPMQIQLKKRLAGQKGCDFFRHGMEAAKEAAFQTETGQTAIEG